MKTIECKFKDCLCKTNDDWKVKAPEFGNCFWTYLTFNCRRHTLKETAALLGLTISVVTSSEKRILDKLQRKLNKIK